MLGKTKSKSPTSGILNCFYAYFSFSQNTVIRAVLWFQEKTLLQSSTVNQKNSGCPIPGSVYGQAGCSFEQPGLVEVSLYQGRKVGTRRFLRSAPTQTILWLCGQIGDYWEDETKCSHRWKHKEFWIHITLRSILIRQWEEEFLPAMSSNIEQIIQKTCIISIFGITH